MNIKFKKKNNFSTFHLQFSFRILNVNSIIAELSGVGLIVIRVRIQEHEDEDCFEGYYDEKIRKKSEKKSTFK